MDAEHPRDEARSVGPTGPVPPASSPGGYPHQELTEQHVQPGRSRLPWLVAGVVVLCGVVALALWLVLDDDGESSREAYCAALRDVTNDGDLTAAIEDADEETGTRLREVADLAPDAVAGDWDVLADLAEDPAALAESNSLRSALEAWNALRTIARDAEDNCDLSLDLPLE
jgi:hypothetical protein